MFIRFTPLIVFGILLFTLLISSLVIERLQLQDTPLQSKYENYESYEGFGDISNNSNNDDLKKIFKTYYDDVSYNVSNNLKKKKKNYNDMSNNDFTYDVSNIDISSNTTINISDVSNQSVVEDSLDDCIFKHYQKYWDENSKMYDDKYILKTQINPPACSSCPSSYYCYGNSKQCLFGQKNYDLCFNIQDVSLNKTDISLNKQSNWNMFDLSWNAPSMPNWSWNINNNNRWNNRWDMQNKNSGSGSSNSSLKYSETEYVQNREKPMFDNYYNALPKKESTPFVPITADFSKFGR